MERAKKRRAPPTRDPATIPIVSPEHQIVRKRDLFRIVGLSATVLDKEIAAGRFPKPFALTPFGRAKGWVLADILRWRDQRIAASGGQ